MDEAKIHMQAFVNTPFCAYTFPIFTGVWPYCIGRNAEICPQKKDESKVLIHQRNGGSLLIDIATSLESSKQAKR